MDSQDVPRRLIHAARSAIERLKYRATRSAVSSSHQSIIANLRREGVHVTSLDRLFGDSTASAAYFHAASFIRDPVNLDSASLWRDGASSRDITPVATLTHLPDLYLAALDEQVLTLAAAYLGQPAAFHGSVVRTSAVDGRVVGTRIWHQDAEDARVLRMVVYLNDVEPGGGPFEFIPRSARLSYRQFEPGAKITDEMVERIVPRHFWKQIYGPAGTVILCDTASTFHHESVQERYPRSVVMSGYTSRLPWSMDLAMSHFPLEPIESLAKALIPANRRAHVFGWRNLSQAQAERERSAVRGSRRDTPKDPHSTIFG